MPVFYEKASQVMNFHNLNHVADDVRFMQSDLSSFSAFPFESLLGQIRKLVRTPNNPLIQVCRRLHEMDMCNSSEIITKKSLFSECIKKNFSLSANDNDSRDCELL